METAIIVVAITTSEVVTIDRDIKVITGYFVTYNEGYIVEI